MIETYTQTAKETELSCPDTKYNYVAIASYKGRVITYEWFYDYNTAATWCLDYTMRYKVLEK